MRSRLLGGLLAKALDAAASSRSPSSAAAAVASSCSSLLPSRGFAAAAAEAAKGRLLLLLPPGPSSSPLLPSSSSRSFSSSASSSASTRASRKKAAAAAAAGQQQQEAKAPAAPTATATAMAPTAAGVQSSPPASGSSSRRVANSRYTMTPAAGPGGSMGVSLRASPVASGVLAEPFRGDPPPLPLSSWVTPSGWKLRWRRWVSAFKSMYSLAKCKKLVPGWTLPAFKREALQIYEATCRALAAGDRGALRQALTPLEYAAAKAQLRAREDAGWRSIDWALAEPRPDAGRDVEVVHARLVMANAKDERAGFAQVTVRVRSRHSFEARDSRGRVVASGGGGGDGGGGGGARGASSSSSSSSSSPAPASAPPSSPSAALASRSSPDSDRVVDVVDTWVLERFLGGGPSARWRLAGRLSADVGADGGRRRRGGFFAWLAARKGGAGDE